MIYHKEFGIMNFEGLLQATKDYLQKADGKQYLINFTYYNGAVTTRQFKSEEERDSILDQIQKTLKCTEVK